MIAFMIAFLLEFANYRTAINNQKLRELIPTDLHCITFFK